MSIYTNPPEWEDAGKKPPSSKRTEGWRPGDRVPASWLNWFWFSTVNSLREIAQAFVDHRDASAPHDGHETKDGATAKVEAHSAKTTGVHGVDAGFHVAKTARADQRVGWDDVVDKPAAFPAAAHNHDDRYYTKAQVDQKVQAHSIYTLFDHFINSGEIETAQIAGIKNSMFRGKNLGTSYTSEQQSQVANGKFLDLWVGDYWVINGTRYYIAAFNYYLGTGNTNLTTNHITLVPAGILYTHHMNPSHTTEGGYFHSEMRTSGLDQAKTKIHVDFAGHVLTHRRHISNAASNGYATAGIWFDSDVELMNEVMVFGSVVSGRGTYNIGAEKSQLPLFALRPDLISIRSSWWLRDVATVTDFAYVSNTGHVARSYSSNLFGVRPVFSIS